MSSSRVKGLTLMLLHCSRADEFPRRFDTCRILWLNHIITIRKTVSHLFLGSPEQYIHYPTKRQEFGQEFYEFSHSRRVTQLYQDITITRTSSARSFSLPPEDLMLKILTVAHYIITLILSTNSVHVNVEQLKLIISCYISLCKIYH